MRNFYAVFVLILFSTIIEGKNYYYKTDYYREPIDHFSFVSNKTFFMKFLYNDTFWDKENGPIFFYTGNEGDIELFAQNTGFMWDIAPEFKALLLFAEHRYYGASLPFGNDSYSTPEKLGFLTSEQALADFAEFIVEFKKSWKAEKSPVIAFGGSYGGMLSSWFRIKYPHIIQGAIAGSAPILQFTDITPCQSFGRIVTEDFRKESEECSNVIRNSWKYINEFGKSDAGRKWLQSNWKICTPLNSKDDINILKGWLTNVYTNLAMVDYPYSADFLAPLPPFPVKEVCTHLINSSETGKILLRQVFKGLSVYFNYTGNSECLDINMNAVKSLGDLGWDYQACTEMVMPFCYDGIHDFFEPMDWDLKAYGEECYRKWKVKPKPFMTQIMYGGRDIKAASNIVFSNGLLDPWSSGGVMKNISDSVISLVIPEGAHHLDLRAADENDPTSVILVRKIEKEQIRKWIGDWKKQSEGNELF